MPVENQQQHSRIGETKRPRIKTYYYKQSK